MAMVVDEFGTIVGMLTVEDVLEQVVGRIEDEHDEKMVPRLAEAGTVELDGATRIRDLESEYGIEIANEGEFETLAGFVLFRRGEIPKTRGIGGISGPPLHRAGDGSQPHRARARGENPRCRKSFELEWTRPVHMLGVDSHERRVGPGRQRLSCSRSGWSIYCGPRCSFLFWRCCSPICWRPW
jgi:hypothetical protein